MCTWIVTSLIITLIYNAKLYSLITVPLVRHQRNISSHDYKASDVFNTSTLIVRTRNVINFETFEKRDCESILV